MKDSYHMDTLKRLIGLPSQPTELPVSERIVNALKAIAISPDLVKENQNGGVQIVLRSTNSAYHLKNPLSVVEHYIKQAKMTPVGGFWSKNDEKVLITFSNIEIS